MSPGRSDSMCGISLYTLLAAVVVLGVLTSVLVTSFNGSHSKGQAAWALVKSIGQAANRYHLDTTCYATSIDQLWHNSGTANSCGTEIPTGMWKGPYISKMAIVSATANEHSVDYTLYADASEFGTGAVVGIQYMHGSGQPYVWIKGLSESVAKAALAACGASEDSDCNQFESGDPSKPRADRITYLYAPADH